MTGKSGACESLAIRPSDRSQPGIPRAALAFVAQTALASPIVPGPDDPDHETARTLAGADGVLSQREALNGTLWDPVGV